MRTTLDLPDPLFARLKARAVLEHTTLKKLLQRFVEDGLNATIHPTVQRRSADTLPCLRGPLALTPEQLSNASLVAALDD
jgi:hypothetical protein